MAISLQDQGKVWQKVQGFIGNANANPAATAAFKALRDYLTQQKGAFTQLQFIPFTAAQMTTDGGYAAADAPCKVYGIFLKGKRTTGTTAAFVSAHDATTNGATTTTLQTFRLNAAGQSHVYVNPVGFPAATALTIASATAVGGATESAAADAADGFVIIGAP